ncbi:MAG: hypothetical protein KatS3mg113_0615 [Planctomycetaceae bacterium]|nr:MAG: hypothetical protein KatS3mg113_0615 [Planctomycetaceae bacterium]
MNNTTKLLEIDARLSIIDSVDPEFNLRNDGAPAAATLSRYDTSHQLFDLCAIY